MIRNSAIGATAVLLAACQPDPQSPQENLAVLEPAEGSAENGSAASANSAEEKSSAVSTEPANNVAQEQGNEAGRLPAPNGLRFVGLWAADAKSCESRAWRFTANSLRTPAGSVCRFDQVTPAGGGYDLTARCTAEGPETDDRLEIRFAESAQAMLFESRSIADAGLVYCGPENG